MMLGMDDDANPDYGSSPDQPSAMIADVREITKILRRKHVADMLDIS